ncbi:MAG TPA: GDSL-type esterase/lipase family protein [Polyangiaceae bacterium]|nr:GDSL-type esterase/lipase family protein [Polyangiaceae bacterium]
MHDGLFRSNTSLGEPLPGSGSPAGSLSTVAPVGSAPRTGRAFKRALGMLLGLMLMIAATYLLPPLHFVRPWVPSGRYVPFWNVVGREWLGEEAAWIAEARSLEALSRAADANPPSAAPPPRVKVERALPTVFPPYATKQRVERPKHEIEPNEALDPYYRKLTLADLGVPFAIARAGHWGDSVLGMDGITSGIRRRLQSRFGDAGHGFHLMDRYHGSYKQQGIDFYPGGGWQRCLIVQGCNDPARRYGYGGLSVQSVFGSVATWSTPKQGFGSSVSSFELWFAHQELGGTAEIVIDNDARFPVETRGPHLQDGWQLVYLPEGAKTITVRALGSGVRAYGVVLENDGPGVVWDGMALIGGSTRSLQTQDPEHIMGQIRRRGLDLVVFMFGGNDLQRNYVDLRQSMEPYYVEFTDVLQKFRAGRTQLPCLIMSVTDHGKRNDNGDIYSVKFVKTLSDAQREVARRNGCGFFDTYEATGGEGTAARWFRARPQLISPDLGHPNGLGHELIAGLLTNALLYGYEDYRARMEGKPLPELSTVSELAEGASQSAELAAPVAADGVAIEADAVIIEGDAARQVDETPQKGPEPDSVEGAAEPAPVDRNQ